MRQRDELLIDLMAFEDRAACSDAERRAALFLHDELRADGAEAWVETLWVRPSWAGSLFWHALLAIAATLLGTLVPVAGLAVCALVLVSFAVGRTGRPALLDRLLLVRRATQVVLVEPDDPGAQVTVWVHAATDQPREGFGVRLLLGPLRPAVWTLSALVALVATGALRVAAPDTESLGVLQFVPVLVLLLVAGVAIDAVLAGRGDGVHASAGVVAAIATWRALRADPPPGLSAGLLLGGAGSEAAPLGLREWLRTTRPDPEHTLLVDVGPVGLSPPVWAANRPQLVTALAGVERVDGGDRGEGWRPQRGRPHRPAPGLRRLPRISVSAATDYRDGAHEGAGSVAQLVATGLRALELQPARSRAKATNQS